jgi:molecular chaperone DnaK
MYGGNGFSNGNGSGRGDVKGSGPVIGIDLGTSTSAIAVLLDARPELMPDLHGDRIIPSVVQIAAGAEGAAAEYIVGTPAKAGAVTFHDRTVQEVKRLMGTGEAVRLGEKTLVPEAVSALILRHLKLAAETHLAANVRDVVLSVPARFANEAREATRRAAEMAGLNVLRLINEPTAAALAYGLNKLEENQKILVFDFGGGTLDVTILEMFEGVLDVKTSVGDDKLGGKDIDEVVVGILRDAFKDQHGKKLPPPSRDRKLAQILKEEAERIKKRLSTAHSVDVDLPTLTAEGGMSFTLSRETLEDKLEEMLMRAMMLVNEALSRARLRWDEIDVVLPVGGSSRMPLFRRALEFAWGRPVEDRENPDEAVARGAAVAAGIERGVFDRTAQDILILDVSPHRLGVATIKEVGAGQFIEDYFSEIIPKDTKLPAVQQREYATRFSGADPLSIRIYEATSESNLCRDHCLVSELPLRTLVGGEQGEPVQVEFRYTLDGTLDVSVRYVSAPVVRAEGRFHLSGGNAGGVNGASVPLPRWQDSPQAEMCMPLLEQAERMEQKNPEAAPNLSATADALKRALSLGDEAELRRNIDLLTDLLFELA